MRRRAQGLWAVLCAVLLLAACTSSGATIDPTETSGATIDPTETTEFGVSITTDPDNALRAEVTFPTEPGVSPVVEVVDQNREGFRVTAPASEGTTQTIPLLGLKANETYTVDVTAGESSASASFTTGDLPDDLPPFEVETTPESMAGGLTLFNAIPLRGGEGEGEPTDDGYLLAVDDQGDLVWYYRQTHSIQDARRTESGEILFIHFETGAKKLDPAEGTVTEWAGTTALDDTTEDPHGRPYAGSEAVRVETDQMHHEVIELPNGNLMTLSRELAEVDGYPEPICEEEEGADEFAGSYQVATDTVVEFQPDDGAIVNEWSLFDMVDPVAPEEIEQIRAAEFCSQYLNDVYPDMNARDWTHANAVVLDEERNALLVSARHLDQILAIRYQEDQGGPAGELIWRLGEGGDFELTSGEWFLHQHAPQVLEDGTIMIYDNGNERSGTSLDDPDALPYSRAVQYRIDTENWTAEQVWEHRADAPGEAVYAPFVGDADVLDGGTVLITHGGLLDPPAHTPRAEGVVAWGRVIEVDYKSGEIVFDLSVKDPARETGWIVYRSERIPTIYPQGYSVEQIGG